MDWKTINTGPLLAIQYVKKLFFKMGDVLMLTQKLGENIVLKIKSFYFPQYYQDTREWATTLSNSRFIEDESAR